MGSMKRILTNPFALMVIGGFVHEFITQPLINKIKE